ncbi:MAG: LAGLIDADG family homing endonuclease [archaeon]|jgi:hypothetical protein
MDFTLPAINKKIVYNKKFVYLFGYFSADGSFYKDSSSHRFEFVDGTSIKEEQFYSLNFIQFIQKLILDLFGITGHIRKRDNKYVLTFRNKKLAEFFENEIGQKPGPKTKTVNLPGHYKTNSLEKFFWLGFLDGDGCVPRNGRKIVLESASKLIITSFQSFLERNKIKSKYYERKLHNRIYYGTRITSVFFDKYAEVVGFLHPRKNKWLNEKIGHAFYLSHSSNIKNFITKENYINYLKIFNQSTVYLVNSKELFKKYGIKCDHRKNRRLEEITKELYSKGLKDKEILKIISKYRWKAGKGSNISITLPTKNSPELEIIAKFARTQTGGIKLSKQHIQAFNENPSSILQICEDLFGLNPKITSKNELIFCSNVLKLLFSKIISRSKENYTPPKFHEEILCSTMKN